MMSLLDSDYLSQSTALWQDAWSSFAVIARMFSPQAFPFVGGLPWVGLLPAGEVGRAGQRQCLGGLARASNGCSSSRDRLVYKAAALRAKSCNPC